MNTDKFTLVPQLEVDSMQNKVITLSIVLICNNERVHIEPSADSVNINGCHCTTNEVFH